MKGGNLRLCRADECSGTGAVPCGAQSGHASAGMLR